METDPAGYILRKGDKEYEFWVWFQRRTHKIFLQIQAGRGPGRKNVEHFDTGNRKSVSVAGKCESGWQWFYFYIWYSRNHEHNGMDERSTSGKADRNSAEGELCAYFLWRTGCSKAGNRIRDAEYLCGYTNRRSKGRLHSAEIRVRWIWRRSRRI